MLPDPFRIVLNCAVKQFLVVLPPGKFFPLLEAISDILHFVQPVRSIEMLTGQSGYFVLAVAFLDAIESFLVSSIVILDAVKFHNPHSVHKIITVHS